MNHRRRAGISVPLFSLRSGRSWGIGEIADIQAMSVWLRAAGQSVLQILPMNELAPDERSPYSALTAMALDPQFLSGWRLDDSEVFEQVWKTEIEDARRSPTIDYRKVRALKSRALKASFDRFYHTEWMLDTPAAGRLRTFVASSSWWLDEYSLYRALRARAGERPWVEWEPPLRNHEPEALARARTELGPEILYYQYVQWLLADQWQLLRQQTPEVEILGDFPFMVTLDSADVWSRQREFILDASVGTPPDAFSETGQEWGLPPYNWDEAWKNDFEWLRMRARRLAELYDGFRIDHLVGFYRTYVRPLDGRAPYFMPAAEDEQRRLGETVMRIMMATGADISVEDLGTVPEFVRESVTRLGLPGYRVLRWEPEDPSTYPPVSIAMTGTHDTTPLAVWWESLTPGERGRFGVETPVLDAATRDALLRKMHGSGSDLVLLPIQDVFGWRDRINEPATVTETNWTYALPWPVDQMLIEPVPIERAGKLAESTAQTDRCPSTPEIQD